MTYTEGVGVCVEGLEVAYGPRTVVRGIDLDVGPGEVFGLLGPNGAGKTTTIAVLATLLRPRAGRVTVAGYDVTREPERVRGVLRLTGQSTSLDDLLTGRELLHLMARLEHLPRRQARSRAEEMLERFDLVDAADRRVGSWSGGMRRRLDLAASLLGRPRVLVLDEPTTGLDPRSRQVVWDLVREVADAGTTVFLTTQYLDEADRLADRIAVLDGGLVVAQGTPGDLKRGVGGAYLQLDLVDGRRTMIATDGSVRHGAEVLLQVAEGGDDIRRWELREPTLDEVFLALTGGRRHPPGPSSSTEVRP